MDKNSLQAWEKILHQLPERRKVVLREVIADPGQTGQEIAINGRIPGAWKRLSELEREGLVYRGHNRKCSITGQVAAAWYPEDITGRPS